MQGRVEWAEEMAVVGEKAQPVPRMLVGYPGYSRLPMPDYFPAPGDVVVQQVLGQMQKRYDIEGKLCWHLLVKVDNHNLCNSSQGPYAAFVRLRSSFVRGMPP
jgi:hypothetical protein